jgi:hypothetical protein
MTKNEALIKAQMWAGRAEKYADSWPNLSSTDYPHLSAATAMADMWSSLAEVLPAAERPPQTEYGSLL